MYSRSRNRSQDFRLPEHYSGVAFDRAHPAQPRPERACAEGLPAPVARPAPPPPPPDDGAKTAPSPAQVGETGLFASLGGEELLLCGLILLLAGQREADGTILLLLLLLLER